MNNSDSPSALFNALRGFSWQFDADGRPSAYGRQLADWLGLTRRQLQALPPWFLLFGADRRRCREAFARAAYLREKFTASVRAFRHDDELIACAVAGTTIYRGGLFQGYAIMLLPADVVRAAAPHEPWVMDIGKPIRAVVLAET